MAHRKGCVSLPEGLRQLPPRRGELRPRARRVLLRLLRRALRRAALRLHRSRLCVCRRQLLLQLLPQRARLAELPQEALPLGVRLRAGRAAAGPEDSEGALSPPDQAVADVESLLSEGGVLGGLRGTARAWTAPFCAALRLARSWASSSATSRCFAAARSRCADPDRVGRAQSTSGKAQWGAL